MAITTGTFFLARQRPETSTDADGTFRLVLRVVDNQGKPHPQAPELKELYVVTWTGPAAAMWLNEHAAALTQGRPLQMELSKPRAMPVFRGSPEIHATVLRCQLAPLAPSWLKHAGSAAAKAGASASGSAHV